MLQSNPIREMVVALWDGTGGPLETCGGGEVWYYMGWLVY
jgi:hypothetical protein